MKKKIAIAILSVCLLFSCNSKKGGSSSSTSATSTADPIIEKGEEAIEQMGHNYTIQKIATNSVTNKQYFEDYIVCTDNSIYYKDKGFGYFIPDNDQNFAHHFDYVNSLSAYGRCMSVDSFYDVYLNKLFEKYKSNITYLPKYRCYDISDSDAVYDFFNYFGYGYVITAYKEGSDIYFEVDKDGKISILSLIDDTSGSLMVYNSYYFDYYGTSTNAFIDTFNQSHEEVKTLIEDVKTLGTDYRSLYKGENVTFEGVVGAHYGLVYVVSDNNGLGIQVTVREEDVPNMKVGNKVKIQGTVSTSEDVTKIDSVSAVNVISEENELVIITDDGKVNSYGHYAANEFFLYPSYSGSLYNTTMSIKGTFEVNSSIDQYLQFAFPAFRNGEGVVLSGKLTIPGTLSLEQKQNIYNAVSTATDDSDSFIIENMVMEFSKNNTYYISALFTEETTLVKDLTVEQKMQMYLGDVIPLPLFNQSRNFVDDHVFAVEDVEKENYTWYGIVQLPTSVYDDIVTPYINSLIKDNGYVLNDHFGDYLDYEFHILTKGNSVIEIAASFVESAWGENASWMIHMCLYQGTPIKPLSTAEYIESVVGENQFVLEDGSDNYSYQKYTMKAYNSDKNAVVLYSRNDDSHYDSYKNKLLANGFINTNQTFKARGRNHEVFVKNDCYVDICEYVRKDFQHGLNYEKNYRLDITMYKGSEVIKPTYAHDLSKFIELVDYDKSLLVNPSETKPSSIIQNINFSEDINIDFYYTRDQYEKDALTGGYFPNAFIYPTKDSDGSYKKSIDEIRLMIKGSLMSAGFDYNFVEVVEGQESMIQKDCDMYMYTADGLTLLIIVDWDLTAGYIDLKCI